MTGIDTADARDHGTLSCYVEDNCRCTACCAAHRAHRDRAARLKARWRETPLIDAEPVREHVLHLSACGIDPRRAALLAGISPATTDHLLHGYRYHPPTRHMRGETAARLLAVQPETNRNPARARDLEGASA